MGLSKGETGRARTVADLADLDLRKATVVGDTGVRDQELEALRRFPEIGREELVRVLRRNGRDRPGEHPEATLEGLNAAVRKGNHGGRPPVITDDMLHTVLRRRANGESVEDIQPDLIIPAVTWCQLLLDTLADPEAP